MPGMQFVWAQNGSLEIRISFISHTFVKGIANGGQLRVRLWKKSNKSWMLWVADVGIKKTSISRLIVIRLLHFNWKHWENNIYHVYSGFWSNLVQFHSVNNRYVSQESLVAKQYKTLQISLLWTLLSTQKHTIEQNRKITKQTDNRESVV